MMKATVQYHGGVTQAVLVVKIIFVFKICDQVKK